MCAKESTQKDTDALASEGVALVFKLYNGIGDIPFFMSRSNMYLYIKLTGSVKDPSI